MNSNNTYKIFEDKVDKLVHDTFANENIVTTDNEWKSLSEKLHGKKKTFNYKRNLFFGLVLFLLGSGSTYLLLQTKPKNDKENLLSKNTTAALQNTTAKPSPLNDTEKSDIVKNDESKNEAPINEKENLQKILENNKIVDENNFFKNNSITISKNKTQNEHIKSKKNNSIKNVLQTNTNENTISNNIDNKDNNNTTLKNETFESNQSAEIVKIETIEDIKPDVVIVNNNVNNKIDVLENSTQKKEKQTKQKRARKAAPEHYFDNEKSLYIEAFTGVNNSFKNENSFAAFLAPNGYNNMRLQQESALSSVTAGVHFKVRKQHITFSSGLHFLQLGDVIQYDSSFNSNSIVYKANGKTTFSYIEIPFVAGYEWANKRWGFALQGGLSTGLLTQLKGNYVSIQNFNTQLFDVNQNKATFRKAIFNVVISPQIQYYLNDKINIFATPTYKRNLQAITTIDADLKQRYQIFGMQIGIRTKLN